MKKRNITSFKSTKTNDDASKLQKTGNKSLKLYDDLLKSVNDRPVDKYVLSSICGTIGRHLSLEHREALFLIVYHHYKLHNIKSKKLCPYNGQFYKQGTGAAFNMDNFPDDLIHLIVRYIGIAQGIEDF